MTHRFTIVWLLVLTSVGWILPSAQAQFPRSSPDPDQPIRGITISTHTDGREYGSEVMGPTIEALERLGANWVTVHPYAWISNDGEVRYRPFDAQYPPAMLRRPIEEAHARGMKILIKPHLGYWGSRFKWRGEIQFEDDESWARFFTTYQEWIVAVAQACGDADGFVIGTELDATLEHESEWRLIIEDIRFRTQLPLTYAANWSMYPSVPFWDEMDAIGIQAYFPVDVEGRYDDASLAAGWDRINHELHEYAERYDIPVVLTELGYNRNMNAPARPWEYHTDGQPEAERVQTACLRAALDAIDREPLVLGCFLWKWFPEPYPAGRNFQLATPALMDIIRDAWLEESTARSR